MSFLLSIETANPKYCHLQSEVLDFYINAIDTKDQLVARKIKVIAAKSGIKKRYSVLKDFSLKPSAFTFFPQNKSLEPIPTLSQRMECYQQNALALSLDAVNKIKDFKKIKSKITHIITVTCTGLFAPGLDLELIDALKLKPTTNRSSINFMGCNAAILALKQADQICNSQKNALVLVVCVELCTLHFQKKFTDDYILSNLLFSDGAAAALIGSKNESVDEKFSPYKMTSFKSIIINEGKKDMAWKVSETGFIMNLTSHVSELLNRYLPDFLGSDLLAKKENMHWAVHPGGRKIIDDFCKTLDIDKTQLKHSYNTLENFGNMSSPTILFVLKSIIETEKSKKNIFAAAFGPGLSIETVLLKPSTNR